MTDWSEQARKTTDWEREALIVLENGGWPWESSRDLVLEVLRAVEPIIRADERSRTYGGQGWVALDDAEQIVRAEREKIGDAIDARRKAYMLNEAGTGTAIGAYVECEQIAREGSDDEAGMLARGEMTAGE